MKKKLKFADIHAAIKCAEPIEAWAPEEKRAVCRIANMPDSTIEMVLDAMKLEPLDWGPRELRSIDRKLWADKRSPI